MGESASPPATCGTHALCTGFVNIWSEACFRNGRHSCPGYTTCVHIDIYLTHFMYMYIDSRMQLVFFYVSFFFLFDSLLTDDSFSSVFVHPCLNSLHTGVQGR